MFTNANKRWCAPLAVIAAGALAVSNVAADEHETGTLADAITNGEFNIGFRYRFEHVNDDNPGLIDDTADASTIRLRANYETMQYRAVSAFVEFDYVGELLVRDFNSLSGSSPARNRYPVVADSKGADLNQLYVDFALPEDTGLRVGRQRILRNNQRFVGGVGWRQNEQTYDGVTVTTDIGRAGLSYSFATAVQRIFGSDVAAGRHDVDAHLLDLSIPVGEAWTASPYFYRIDNSDAPAFSTSTLGVRGTGKIELASATKLDVAAEYARQSEAANNPTSYDADYLHASVMANFDSGLSLGLAFESLGGSQSAGGMSFRTPLATLHAFQGWADKFLATPAEGVQDVFATVKYKAGPWALTGVYHDFSAESGSADWGSEIDFSAARPLGDRYRLLLKTALYDADLHSADTWKLWIMFSGQY